VGLPAPRHRHQRAQQQAAPNDRLAALYRHGPLAFLPLERDGQQDWCSIVWSTTPSEAEQPDGAG
jgi:2-polyprenyl-6-methoxyphenol hydroxylase-like FAD-dependent oxidoreductase